VASPLGHALVGYAIGRLPSDAHARARWLAPACALLAVAPDLDFVPGWIAGTPALYHQGASHSVTAALFAAAVCAPLIARARGDLLRCFGWLFAAYASHLLIDWLGADARPPLGIPLFWPLSQEHHLSPVPLLPGISHSPTGHEGRAAWLVSLLAWHNVFALAVEVALALPLLAWAWLRTRRASVGE
jgi:inner membrane protein